MANLSKIVKISWTNYQTLKNGGSVSGQTFDANAIYLIEDNGALDIGDGSSLTADMKAYLLENPATPIIYNGNFYLPQTNINDDDYVYYYYHAGDEGSTYGVGIDWGELAIDEDFYYHFLTNSLFKGRIWYGDNSNIATSLPIGSAGQVLKVVNGLPAWGSVAWSEVTGKPTFATVATSGSYTDLSNKPTIPATNVIPATTTANKMLVSTTTSGTAKWSDWSSAGFLKTNASGVISVDTNIYVLTSDVSSAGNAAASKIVSRSATGTIQSEKIAISSGTTTKATMQYNTTEDCIEFIFS